ncbi:MAG TPA: 2-C-methyl-D-erythritol 4-phosphate cytidylyltransferase [Vicinamibacteria bacterium]|nr:2-C-methyl-D-erythritol 4-phosphate cytidylyltransferase [Vicinamibacteria bacterium]
MDSLAILVAAGSGERMGAGRPKAFLPLAGQPMLLRAATAFQAAPSVEAIIAVVPRSEIDAARALLATLPKLAAVVAGGPRRQDSVAEGLRQVPLEFGGLVLVHDAARPLVDVATIEAVCAAARETGAALPVLALVDTVKHLREGTVDHTLDRRELAAAQTPQGFRRELLVRAYAEAERTGAVLTDEAMALERLGIAVRAVQGATRNRKLTTPDDLAWAEDLLMGEDRRGTGHARIGTGFDAHRLVSGRPLVLGGVRVEHTRGLEGHSDGDCLVHAVCDALLGAVGAGDLGGRYPSDDPRWKDVSSTMFLAEAAREVAERGYVVENVDATVVAQEPRLSPYTERMRMRLSACLRVPPDVVSVKAKSTDGLGPFGRGEGIAALATLLLKRR